MIRKSGYRFSEEIMLNKKIERDDDSKKSHSALVTIRYAIEHGTAALNGELGLSIGTAPFPFPTNTPGPTITDDLLPMMTLGFGDVRLDRVPSGQRIASPDSKPRRPSSPLTLATSRVQD